LETKTQEITRRRCALEECHKMAEAGILDKDDRV
jgi:hypothetical protein